MLFIFTHSVLATIMYKLLVFFVFGTPVLAQDNYVIVNTPKGEVKGHDVGDYTTFFGVPYAKVDEEKPFGVSLSYPNFATPFEATDPTIKCPQAFFAAEGTIQCLRLNIYVPKTTEKNLPVFVWFHGGGFFFGSAGDYGGQYLTQHNIIVVTANYRLGPYGFLCLDDAEVPGNQGLKDQVEALKWVKENIAAFGGDPDKVTIAGESYGGGLVDLHMYANTEKLFHQAVVQSGGAQVEGMFVKPDYSAAVKLAGLFNHTACNTKDALKFLAQKDPRELMKVFNSSGILLRACKEKKFKRVQSFLTEDPLQFHKEERVRDTPVLFGYNSKETFDIVANKPEEFFESMKDVFFDKLNTTFNLKKRELKRLAVIVKKFYLGGKGVTKDSMLPLADFLADIILNHAAEASVKRLVAQGAKVYKYIFSYIGNSPFKNISGAGAFHTEELQYLFQFQRNVLKEPEHLMMRDRMTTLWANFVKYGDPTPEATDLLPVKWKTVPNDSSPSIMPYMNLDLKMEMLEDVYHGRIAFWDLLWIHYYSKIACSK